jgi:hypothetical protein
MGKGRLLTVSAIDFMDSGKGGQVSHEEEVKKQLNVRGCLVMLELRVLEQALILGVDFSWFVYMVAAVSVPLSLL